MSLSPPVHPLAIPTTLSIRTSRVFDEDCFGGRLSPTSAYSSFDRNSRVVLEQTELVYDQLLAERQRKLQRRIDEKRLQFDEKINELKQTDEQKAAEFKRWADAALLHVEAECAEEMRRLREDYELKFARLERSMADQSRSNSGASSPCSPSPN